MQTNFTGYEYLQIDVATNNPFGGNKLTFEDRIKWTENNHTGLENEILLNKQWKEKPLYIKAVQALRKAEKGIPTGHMIGLDAVCSGMQIMSVLTGCLSGAKSTGLIDSDRRPDAYTDVTAVMSTFMGTKMHHARIDVKDAVMKCLYGSKAEPKRIFGEDTAELQNFYKALMHIAPGACQLLQTLLDSWQDWELVQQWVLPDGGHARNRVMQKVEKRIEVNELDHSTFTYKYEENQGERRGLKNVANVIHSIDAWVLRSVIRRCSYDSERTKELSNCITEELLRRTINDIPDYDPSNWTDDLEYYMAQYSRSGIVDPVILPYLSAHTTAMLPSEYLRKLNTIVLTMLEHKPFPIITVHDEFKCHPNNMNHLRAHYRNVLVELAEANLMQDILSQLHGVTRPFNKLSNNLPEVIKGSNYALC